MPSSTVDTYFGSPTRAAAKAPGYQEAYPRLTLKEVAEALQQQKRLCVWVHPHGAHRGYGLVRAFEGEIDLLYLIFPFYGEPSRVRVERLQLRDIVLGQGRTRRLLVCPVCSKGVTKLIFFRAWKCKGCQGLGYRSSAITAQARRSEQARRLEAELRAGRPKGVHESTMQRKRAELKCLRQTERQNGKKSISTTDKHRLINLGWVRARGHEDILEHLSSAAKSLLYHEFDVDYMLAWSRGGNDSEGD